MGGWLFKSIIRRFLLLESTHISSQKMGESFEIFHETFDTTIPP